MEWSLSDISAGNAAVSITGCNAVTCRYGLEISHEQALRLISRQAKVLKATGRIEFGEGVIKKLVMAFCDSPYITRESYEDTLMELIEMFYFFKGEAAERISDDELIDAMKDYFDNECEGSLDYLSGTALEELCRGARYQ